MLVRRRAICESAEDKVRGMTEEFVQVAMETAAHHARRIRGRAAWTTFVTMIIRHAADDLADRFACLQRQAGGSLEDWVRTRDGARVRHREVVPEADGRLRCRMLGLFADLDGRDGPDRARIASETRGGLWPFSQPKKQGSCCQR
jgi:hypothetical protein